MSAYSFTPEQDATGRTISGSELQVGDCVGRGSFAVVVTRFDPHPGLDGAPARIAVDPTGRGMTVFDNDFLHEYPIASE